MINGLDERLKLFQEKYGYSQVTIAKRKKNISQDMKVEKNLQVLKFLLQCLIFVFVAQITCLARKRKTSLFFWTQEDKAMKRIKLLLLL